MFDLKLIKRTGIVMLCMATLTGCGSAQNKGSRISGGNNVDKVLESRVAADSRDATDEKSDKNISDSLDENNTLTNIDSENEAVTTNQVPQPYGENENAGNPPDESVDIDLTVMSSDMIYATVYQLMFESEDYAGKTIKMRGTYYASWYERTQKYYHCVIIKDATACCSQGLEFIWDDGSHIYPDEYPADETEVEVIGTFEIYTEDGYEYCRLKDASLQIINPKP